MATPMVLRERDPGQELIDLCASWEGASPLFVAGPWLDIWPHLVDDERVRSVVQEAIVRARSEGWSANDVRYVLGESVAVRLVT